MPKGPFNASQFVATEWNSAADKAAFGNTLSSLHRIGLEAEPAYQRLLSTTLKLLFPYCSLCGGRDYAESLLEGRVGTTFRHQIASHNPMLPAVRSVSRKTDLMTRRG